MTISNTPFRSCPPFSKSFTDMSAAIAEGIVFRRMRPGDREGVQSFFDEMGPESAAFFNVNHGNEKRVMAFFADGKPDHRFWVAEAGGVIVGLAFIWDLFSMIPWFGVAVRDGWQGRHIGTGVVNAVCEECAAEGRGGLLLRTAETNRAARALYEKCGFEQLGRHPSGEILYLKRFTL